MISQGCINNCSYCAIKKVKGRLISRPIENIIDEIRIGVRSGHKHIKLIADDCSCYGFDFNTNFGALIKKISKLR